MVQEWVKVELLGPNRDGEPRRFAVADSTNVSKGQLLQLTDPRTVSNILVYGAATAGVALFEKVAGDGETSMSCLTQGIFEVTASNALVIDAEVGMAVEDNEVIPMTLVSGSIIGRILETASLGEVINMRLNL